MDIIIRMKTGFFETTPFRLQAADNRLLLTPVQKEGLPPMILEEKDIFSITLTQRSHPELEIQTHTALYSGVFQDACLFEQTVQYLKGMNINITCEYKGGSKLINWPARDDATP